MDTTTPQTQTIAALVLPALIVPPHKGTSWRFTACLCTCHYGAGGCDDKVCERIVADESKGR